MPLLVALGLHRAYRILDAEIFTHTTQSRRNHTVGVELLTRTAQAIRPETIVWRRNSVLMTRPSRGVKIFGIPEERIPVVPDVQSAWLILLARPRERISGKEASNLSCQSRMRRHTMHECRSVCAKS